ncbi:MAG: hypothetical protein LBR40_00495 [Bacilli bacterium]|jgi:uncharacterized membrane protein YczE|nr:hypothetical protein [Bacilli bacterium]
MNKNYSLKKNSLYLIAGYILMAIGIALSVRSHLGLSPWDVLNEGFSKSFNVSFGMANLIISFIVIILACLIKIYPGIGTFINSLIVGFLIDSAMLFIPNAQSFIMQLIFGLLGVFILAIGTVFYIVVDLGAGPRDNLLLGVILKFKTDTTYVKPILEGLVLILGFILGGTIGLGTILALLLTGYFMDIFFRLLKFDPKEIKQKNIFEQIKEIGVK